MTRTTLLELVDQTAREIDRSGIDVVPTELIDTIVDEGRRLGASPIALEVLADLDEPRPVRERAYGIVGVGIGRAA